MALDEALARLGLPGKVGRFYLAALELGEAPVSEVAQRAGISRTTAYDLLPRLVEEGLLTRVEKSGRIHLAAEDPEALLAGFDARRALLGSLLPDLKALHRRSTARPRVQTFEGPDGMRKIREDRLQCRSRRLRAILSTADLFEAPGRREMDRYIARRIAAGIALQAIRPRTTDAEVIWPSRASDLRELRYAPPGLAFTMTMYVYDNRVSLVSSRRENFAMIVESDEYAALMDALFELLWQASEPVPEHGREERGPGLTAA